MDNPMGDALNRLYAAHPDLPQDGGRVWEPVTPDDESSKSLSATDAGDGSPA